jgi:hypothetical protein
VLPREFAELLAALNDAELPYVVVGGVAVNLLGYRRATRDVDVLVPCASLATMVVLKRLANRPRDREDLEALERAYGSLPDAE